MQVYSLAEVEVKPVEASRYRHSVLKVAFPQTRKEKLTNKMHYSYGLGEQGVYQNARWSNHSGALLQGMLLEVLSKSHLFKAVLPYTSTANEDLRLESSVIDFSHHIRGEASYSVVSIVFSLIDTHTGNLLKTKRFCYKENTQTTNAKGYVLATQRAMEKLSYDLIAWLR